MNRSRGESPSPKRVLDVGNCVPDHVAICQLLEGRFGAQVDRADQWDDAEQQLRRVNYDLVLVNRKLDIDYSDGLEIIKRIKSDPALRHIPVMLVTNYADHQQSAVAEGALLGFGKLELWSSETHAKLAAVLGQANSPAQP
jgi:CheY-like chemotaxis protein